MCVRLLLGQLFFFCLQCYAAEETFVNVNIFSPSVHNIDYRRVDEKNNIYEQKDDNDDERNTEEGSGMYGKKENNYAIESKKKNDTSF